MLFFPNYNIPGKGVNKRDPNQPRMTTFFEILPRKLWNLCKVNMLSLVVAIPFFIVSFFVTGIISSRIINMLYALSGSNPEFQSTLALLDLILRVVLSALFAILYGTGPVTAGSTYIIRNYGREEHCWLISDFFERFKSNFKQSIVIWIIDLVALFLLTVAIDFYMNAGIYILEFILIFAAIVYTLMHLYIYQILITFDLPLKHIFKNSLIFALAKAPKNLLLLLITLLVHVVIPFVAIYVTANPTVAIVFVLLEILLLPALTSFTTNFFIYSDIEKYINLAQESENQE